MRLGTLELCVDTTFDQMHPIDAAHRMAHSAERSMQHLIRVDTHVCVLACLLLRCAVATDRPQVRAALSCRGRVPVMPRTLLCASSAPSPDQRLALLRT